MGRLRIKTYNYKNDKKKYCYRDFKKTTFNLFLLRKSLYFLNKVIDEKKISLKSITILIAGKILNILLINDKNYCEIKNLFTEKYLSFIKSKRTFKNEILFLNSVYLKIYLEVIRQIMFYY
ncbi:hypothetical protein BNATCHR1115 (nucleomorph) [Bigelowiella natans]|uniref:Uncharacterized protein n=1 Tax=Bigelowiella natans TaxID=227086 RepID=Q3LWD6_BIGNA|nr:hypothetical protein BNATCHR1115 [Bigelowiella natans]ABA27230.1 hypothetical protein [Bigelowiella natans]